MPPPKQIQTKYDDYFRSGFYADTHLALDRELYLIQKACEEKWAELLANQQQKDFIYLAVGAGNDRTLKAKLKFADALHAQHANLKLHYISFDITSAGFEELITNLYESLGAPKSQTMSQQLGTNYQLFASLEYEHIRLQFYVVPPVIEQVKLLALMGPIKGDLLEIWYGPLNHVITHQAQRNFLESYATLLHEHGDVIATLATTNRLIPEAIFYKKIRLVYLYLQCLIEDTKVKRSEIKHKIEELRPLVAKLGSQLLEKDAFLSRANLLLEKSTAYWLVELVDLLKMLHDIHNPPKEYHGLMRHFEKSRSPTIEDIKLLSAYVRAQLACDGCELMENESLMYSPRGSVAKLKEKADDEFHMPYKLFADFAELFYLFQQSGLHIKVVSPAHIRSLSELQANKRKSNIDAHFSERLGDVIDPDVQSYKAQKVFRWSSYVYVNAGLFKYSGDAAAGESHAAASTMPHESREP